MNGEGLYHQTTMDEIIDESNKGEINDEKC